MMVDVKIYFPNHKTSTPPLAYGRVILGGALQLSHLRIFEGDEGLFVYFPWESNPVSRQVVEELRDEIEMIVLKEYRRVAG
jgi:DNA-binding cell septation regulator SpoVG